MSARLRYFVVLAGALLLAGCANPDLHPPVAQLTGSAGEPDAPPPPAPSSEAPAAAQPTPQKALARFATAYINWNYETLHAAQERLAASAVGVARSTELLSAVQSRADGTLRRARVWNRGRVLSIGPDRSRAGAWVVVTEERTGGRGEYDGLPAGDHVTLARVARVPDGWAVSSWEPQS